MLSQATTLNLTIFCDRATHSQFLAKPCPKPFIFPTPPPYSPIKQIH